MKTSIRIGLAAMLCFLLVNIASSASFNSGGGRKKQTNTKSLTALNFKKSPLSLQNGYHYRGGLTFNSTSKSNIIINNNSAARFQKGNNLYVLPYKPKPFYNKFKTPQKELK